MTIEVFQVYSVVSLPLADAVQKEAAAAAANAEETSKKNQANEKMIVWLNKQLTAAQLSGGSTSKARIPAVPPYGANLGQTGPMPAVPMAGTFLRPRHPGPVPSALYDSRHGTYVTPAGELSKASLSSAASSGATDDDWVPRSFAASWPGEGAHAAAQAQRAQDAKGHAAISPASVLPKHAAG